MTPYEKLIKILEPIFAVFILMIQSIIMYNQSKIAEQQNFLSAIISEPRFQIKRDPAFNIGEPIPAESYTLKNVVGLVAVDEVIELSVVQTFFDSSCMDLIREKFGRDSTKENFGDKQSDDKFDLDNIITNTPIEAEADVYKINVEYDSEGFPKDLGITFDLSIYRQLNDNIIKYLDDNYKKTDCSPEADVIPVYKIEYYTPGIAEQETNSIVVRLSPTGDGDIVPLKETEYYDQVHSRDFPCNIEKGGDISVQNFSISNGKVKWC